MPKRINQAWLTEDGKVPAKLNSYYINYSIWYPTYAIVDMMTICSQLTNNNQQ